MSAEGGKRLSKEQIERADALAAEALGLPAERREEFLAQRCADDPLVRAEALSLLAHADQAARKGLMERPASLPPMAEPEGPGRRPDFPGAAIAGTPDDREVTLLLGQDADLPAIYPPPAGAGEGWGRYAVRGLVGRGGMGEVLVCLDRDTRRQIALKRMLDPTAEDRVLRSRFVEEAQVTAQLEHPNIVPVYELGKDGEGHVYYTMKLVRGRPLRSLLSALRSGEETQSLAELVQIFVKICDAIGFAHARGVLHRDLKPANVMVGSFGEVLVMDWGLAKIMEPVGSRQTAVGNGEKTVGSRQSADSNGQ